MQITIKAKDGSETTSEQPGVPGKGDEIELDDGTFAEVKKVQWRKGGIQPTVWTRG